VTRRTRSWLAALSGGMFCFTLTIGAQEPAPPASPIVEQTERNPDAPCLQPPPLIRLEDYDGPLHKTVGTFARKVERKSVHVPHYKPERVLCTLESSDKLLLFVADTVDPISILGVGFNTLLGQAQGFDPSFGDGAKGFGRRLIAEFETQTSSRFFSEFAYPTLFSEDPRYYRLGAGGVRKRLAHALEHAVVAHRDDGAYMFNISEMLGAFTGAAMGYAYHPDRRVGFRSVADTALFSILSDSGFDVLREFWPEVAQKFRIPFRGVTAPAGQE
jgi:hypothetical protein